MSDDNVVPLDRKVPTERIFVFSTYDVDNVNMFFENLGRASALTRNSLEIWNSLVPAMCHPVTCCYLTRPGEVSTISNDDIFICLTGPDDLSNDPILESDAKETLISKTSDSSIAPVVSKMLDNFNITAVTYRHGTITGNYYQLSIGDMGWNLRVVDKR